METKHTPMTKERCAELLTTAVPDILLNMIVDNIKQHNNRGAAIELLINRGFTGNELIHDFGFDKYAVIVQLNSMNKRGYTAYTPLGTVAARIPWWQYMLLDEKFLMTCYDMTPKQFKSLPVNPVREMHAKMMDFLLKHVGGTMVAVEFMATIPVSEIKMPSHKNLLMHDVLTARDIILLTDEELDDILHSKIMTAKELREQTIRQIIFTATTLDTMSPKNFDGISEWLPETLAELNAANITNMQMLYETHRRQWTNCMTDACKADIAEKLKTLHEYVNALVA